MTQNITRKDFLRLAAAATASTALAGRAAVAQDAVPEDGAVPQDVVETRLRTLIRGADVLTMDPTLGEQLATDVLVDNGNVVAVGKGLAANGAEVVDAQGMILMPGMIDGHRHVWTVIGLGRMTKFSPSDYPYFPWKMAAVVAMEPEDHYIAELVGGLQAIDSGVTSILDYAHGQDTEAKAHGGSPRPERLRNSRLVRLSTGHFILVSTWRHRFGSQDVRGNCRRPIFRTGVEYGGATSEGLVPRSFCAATARARTCHVEWRPDR